VVLEAAEPAHEVVDAGHLVGDVVQRSPLRLVEGDDVVVGVAPQEGHLVFGPVGDAEPEHTNVEVGDRVDVDGVEHDVRDLARNGRVPVRVLPDHGVHIAGELDQAALGVDQVQAVATAGVVERTRLADHGNAELVQALGRGVDLPPRPHGQGDHPERVLGTALQLEDVVLRAGAP